MFDYGAVILLAEDDSSDRLRAQCAHLTGMNMNTAVIWPPVFYRKGKPDVTIQRNFLRIAQEAGIRVIVELTGQVANLEYLPDCRWKPELAVLNEDGSPALMQNGLGELNYNHPEVKRELETFFRFVVGELKSEPALHAWDIWNETHFKSDDPHTLGRFRDWLADKYKTIDELNRFWHKSYTAFDQIRRDPVTWASIVPDTDWEEFRTENLAEIAGEWAAVIRRLDPHHPVIADNVMSNAVWSEFDRGSDDWKVAAEVDQFGISFYPKTGGRLLKENSPELRTLTFAGAASAGRGSFLVSEMQSHCYSEIFTCERVAPEELTDWNLEALFQGCRGSVYWKLEPFRSGFQLGGRGLILADGTPSKRAETARRFGEFIVRHPDAANLTPFKQAAILYDRGCNFTVKALNTRIRHIIGDDQPAKARMGAAKHCFHANIPFSVTIPERIAELRETLLLLPYQVAMDQELAKNLQAFLERGGTVAACFPFGDIDREGRLFEQLPGGPLNHLTGARSVDSRMDEFQSKPIEIQELEITGTPDILLRSDSGLPLLLAQKTGAGTFFYAAASVWENPEHPLAEAVFRHIAPKPLFEADTHFEYASGTEADYLLVPNCECAEACTIRTNRAAELIFGDGTCTNTGSGIHLTHARHAVLRLAKEAKS